MGSELITIVVVAGALAFSAVVYLVLKPKGLVAGTETSPGEEFSLEAAPANGSNYKLWLKYDINWTGREHEYGLVFDLDIRVDGQTCFNGQLRTGSRAVTESDRQKIKERILAGNKSLPDGVIAPTRVKCSKGRRGGIHFERATMAITETGSRRPGSVVSVSGKVSPSEGTEVNSLYFFLAR